VTDERPSNRSIPALPRRHAARRGDPRANHGCQVSCTPAIAAPALSPPDATRSAPTCVRQQTVCSRTTR
jgi:hypothetical protein